MQSVKGDYNEDLNIYYYNAEPILTLEAQYYMSFGGRGDGKTYAFLKHMLTEFVKSGYKNQAVYVRQLEKQLRGHNNALKVLENLVATNVVSDLTNGDYDCFHIRSGEIYLARFDEELNKKIPMGYPFLLLIPLSTSADVKSLAFPYVRYIFYDEFISTNGYLFDEFNKFMNLISTVVRHGDGVKIFMAGNTVSMSSTYFREMGLTKIVRKMKQGTISLFKTNGLPPTTLAVEYTLSSGDGESIIQKPSDVYFGFDNPKMAMIKDGAWSLPAYPHLNKPYEQSDIKYYYYIIWDYQILKADIVKRDGNTFTNISFTGFELGAVTEGNEITIDDFINSTLVNNKHRIYYYEQMENRICKVNILKEKRDKIGNYIATHFQNYKVFYSDNETGQIVNDYIQWCAKN